MTRFNQYWPSALAVLVAIMAACSDGVLGPTEVSDDRAPMAIHAGGDRSPLNPGVLPSPTQCDIISLEARRVLSVSPGKVTLRVLASYAGPKDFPGRCGDPT